MAKLHGPRARGINLAISVLSVAAISTSAIVSAETVATVNGIDIDSKLATIYLESRIRKPESEATAEQKDAILRELMDLYLLSTQPEAAELANDQVVKAQIELQTRSAIAKAVVSNYLAKNAATEEEIAAAYDIRMDSTENLQFKVRHIQVETQSAAVDLVAQLGKGGDFAELAKTHSVGSSGPIGGELDWLSPEQMLKPFSDAVAALSDGDFTKEPVQTEFGWHVILRMETRRTDPLPLESVRDEIKESIEQTKFLDYMEKLRTESAN